MRHRKWTIATVGMVAAALGALCGQAADYRGMPAGWPHYAAPATNLPPAMGSPSLGGVVVVARPASLSAGAVAYVVPVAYGAPVRYVAAPSGYGYGYAPPVTAYRPAPVVAYLPVTSGSAPGNAYVASTYGTTARYASYAVTPAGLSSGGSEAAAYYGQPTPVNYVPPQFVYRTTYAAVPVYLYRPVTVYDPATGQPTTCLQPSTTTQCQPQRHRWFSWLHPATWFGGGCGASGCQPPAATTTYCASGACQGVPSSCGASTCGQPYYPTSPAAPAIPSVPAPGTTVTPPATTIPSIPRGTVIPPAGTTIPPPPTRVPSGASGLSPADLPPRLSPGTTITPAPGGTFTPQPGSVPSGPGTAPPATGQPPTTVPGGSFPTTPSTTPPSGFGSGFGSGAFHAPGAAGTGSLNASSQGVWGPSSPAAGTINGRTVGRAGVLESGDEGATGRRPSSTPNVIRAPDLGPALPEGVRTLPDLDVPQTPRPASRAPQLIDPRDKTALLRSDPRWAVVPARWPTRPTPRGDGTTAQRTTPSQPRPTQQLSLHPPRTAASDSSAATPRAAVPLMATPSTAAATAELYDDRGWRPAAGY
jgi:hypothetical protein